MALTRRTSSCSWTSGSGSLIGPRQLPSTGAPSESQMIRGYYPLEYISIRLVEELSRQINSGGEIPSPPFSQIMPLGWYQTEFVVATSEDGLEETQAFIEFVMAYEETRPKFEPSSSISSVRCRKDGIGEVLISRMDEAAS